MNILLIAVLLLGGIAALGGAIFGAGYLLLEVWDEVFNTAGVDFRKLAGIFVIAPIAILLGIGFSALSFQAFNGAWVLIHGGTLV